MATKGSPSGKPIAVTPDSPPQWDPSILVEIVTPGTAQLPPIPVENFPPGSFSRQMQHAP